MAIELYPHQIDAVNALRAGWKEGRRRQVLCGPCGFGKSVVAAYMTQAAVARGTATALVVDRRELVRQLSRTLDSFEIDHGVLMAKSFRHRPELLVQVCSAQTLEAKGSFPGMKLLIADEAHSMRQQFIDLMKARPDLYCIALTATPLTKGMSLIYDPRVVNVCTTDWMVEQGYLVAPTVYVATEIDMTGAKVVAGEWAANEVASRGLKIVGDIVSEWKAKTYEYFGGPAKTIVFSATVDHGAKLCERFQKAGFNFQQISYRDKNDEGRQELIQEFRRANSDIHGLVAVEVFSRGFDVPDILIGVDARPLRKSLSNHIQKLGRVMRSSPGKKQVLWLDHAGNYLRFQADTDRIFAEGIHKLDDGDLEDKKRVELTDEDKQQLKCAGCGMVLPRNAVECPGCGRARARRLVATATGTMVLVGKHMKPAVGPHAYLADPDAIWHQLTWMGMHRNSDPILAEKWIRGKFKDLYGKWPNGRFVEERDAAAPCEELIGKIRSLNIAYARGTAKGGRA